VVALSEALSFPASFISLCDTQEHIAPSAEESSDDPSKNSDVALVFGTSDDDSGDGGIDINLEEA